MLGLACLGEKFGSCWVMKECHEDHNKTLPSVEVLQSTSAAPEAHMATQPPPKHQDHNIIISPLHRPHNTIHTLRIDPSRRCCCCRLSLAVVWCVWVCGSSPLSLNPSNHRSTHTEVMGECHTIVPQCRPALQRISHCLA